MYGINTTIPIFILFCLFSIILYDIIFVRLQSPEGTTKKTREQLIIISCAIFFYILLCTLGIVNGICYDLFPDDIYMPYLIDRFLIIGVFIGVFFVIAFDLQILFQFSVIINMSRDAVKKFALALSIWLALTTLPMIVEAILFAAKVIDHGYIYDLARYIALAGAAPLIMYDTVQSIVISVKLFELSKIKRVNGNQNLFKTLLYLSLGCFLVDSIAVAFDLATFITPYRSREYLLCLHLAGSSVAFHAMLQVYLSIYLRQMAIQIIQEAGKGNATSMTGEKAEEVLVPLKGLLDGGKAAKSSMQSRKFHDAPTVIIL